MTRKLPNIQGNCFWYGYQIAANENGVGTILKEKYHTTPALIPAYDFIDNRKPENVKKLKAKWTPDGYILSWQTKPTDDELQKQIYFCIYRFDKNEKPDLEDASKIVEITRNTFYKLPYEKGKHKYRYVVTAVDRLHNESEKGTSKKIKL